MRAYTPEDYMKIVGEAIERAVNRECLIIFFGSILSDRFSQASDIDVGIFCGTPLTPKEHFRVLEEIEKSPILREVDVVDLAKIDNENFLAAVIEGGKVWRSSKELFQSLKKRLKNLRSQQNTLKP